MIYGRSIGNLNHSQQFFGIYTKNAVETYRIENVRLLGEAAGFQATNNVLQSELEKALKGAPVGLPGGLYAQAR